MRRTSLAIIPIALVAVLAFAACSTGVGQTAQGDPTGEQDGTYQQPYPYGPGGTTGSGMMGGMMGPGMMGGWGSYSPNAQPLTLEQANEAVSRFLNAYGGDLELKEVMEFDWNFYAEVEEKSTGIHAMELLVDKYTGQVSPEPGPNMMWNTKYGPMSRMMGSYSFGRAPTSAMPVTPEQAEALAQQFLDANGTGLQAGEPDAFYGYYTLHTLKDGQIEGMLSVNGYTKGVWYHSWHGVFIGMK
ncbi:MAG: hypothetical protein HW388_1517 [Dehalococcoidia bacterium]|nr:hypothetical protein [Dehalococcoidia bacterium]